MRAKKPINFDFAKKKHTLLVGLISCTIGVPISATVQASSIPTTNHAPQSTSVTQRQVATTPSLGRTTTPQGPRVPSLPLSAPTAFRNPPSFISATPTRPTVIATPQATSRPSTQPLAYPPSQASRTISSVQASSGAGATMATSPHPSLNNQVALPKAPLTPSVQNSYKDPFNAKIGPATGPSYTAKYDWRGQYIEIPKTTSPNPNPQTGKGSINTNSNSAPVITYETRRVGPDLANPSDAAKAASNYAKTHKEDIFVAGVSMLIGAGEARVAGTAIKAGTEAIAERTAARSATATVTGEKSIAKNTISNINGAAKPSPNFVPPVNPPSYPPKYLPEGHTVRTMPPTEQYPNGYWKQMNQYNQPVNPSTPNVLPPNQLTRAEFQAQVHVPLPPKQ